MSVIPRATAGRKAATDGGPAAGRSRPSSRGKKRGGAGAKGVGGADPRIRKAVVAGLKKWPGARPSAPGKDGKPTRRKGKHDRVGAGGTVAAMPRRTQIKYKSEHPLIPPMRRVALFEASALRSLLRLFVWLRALVVFLAGTTVDRLRGLDTVERRATRLRLTLEAIGGTFIKFGQQLSVRADVLPYAYCAELTKMLDRVPPFPTEQAIAAIERSTGRPLSETFAVFDPVPIGSASLACVYQAQLFTGERVAVKVRRPGIGELFAADLQALDWLLKGLERLTVVRDDFTVNLRTELRRTLFEELDFRQEARYQDLFRRRAKKKAPRHFFSAPRVYFDLSSREVIVQGFVAGMWLSELISLVEHPSPEGEAHMRSLNIDPKVVARRLLWAADWGQFNDLLFHADPHPANVLVRADNELVFIDFGSCGSYDQSRRRALQQIMYHQSRDDIAGMVQSALHLLEPLPPIDITEFSKELEDIYWHEQCALRSKHAEWWERTTATLWYGTIALAQKYSISMNLDVLRMARATFLYDTLSARLYKNIDGAKEYQKFQRDIGKQTRKRLLRGVRERLTRGFNSQDYLNLDKALDTGYQLVYRVQRFLEQPAMKLPYLIEKGVFAATAAIGFATSGLLFTSLFAAGVAVVRQVSGAAFDLGEIASGTLHNRGYQVLLLALVVTSIRRVLFRLGDKETQ